MHKLRTSLIFALLAFSTTIYSKNPVALIKTSMGDIQVELFTQEAPETVKNFIELAEGKKPFTDPATGKKVTRPFYDGLIFHRVIDKFMIQGGCPLGTGTGNPGYRFADEMNASKLGLDKLKVINNGRPHPWLGIRSTDQYQRTVLLPLYKKLGITSKEIYEKRKAEVAKAVKELTIMDVYSNMGYKYNTTRNSHSPKRGVLAMANSGPNTNGSQFFINIIDTPWLTGKHTVFGNVVKGMDVVDKIGKSAVGPGSKPTTPIKIISIRIMK